MAEGLDNSSQTLSAETSGSQTLVGLLPFRERANSKRARVGSSENSQDLSFDLFTDLTSTMTQIRADLDKQTWNKNNTTKADKDKFLTPISNGLDILEKRLSDIGNFCFSMAKSHDKLVEEKNGLIARMEKLESTISVNVASGDLVSEIDKSATYKDLCNQTMNSNLLSKIPNLDLGVAVSVPREALVETIKKKLNETLPPNTLDNVVITPLAKETRIDNEGKNIIPVLFKSKDKENRSALEKALKNRNFNINFHWPKELVPIIKKIRVKVANIENNELNLKNKQILVRPSFTGKSLSISYREDFNKSWELLEFVKTPATNEMLKNTSFIQPCTSKYFKL